MIMRNQYFANSYKNNAKILVYFHRHPEDYMLKNKYFWNFFIMPGSILGWLFIIFGLLNTIENESIKMAWMIITGLWCIGHPLELTQAIPAGKKAGLSTRTIVIKTLVFGITWWFPLKLGYIDK